MDCLSRLTLVKRLSRRDSQAISEVMINLAKYLGTNLKTITVDHGKKFAGYKDVEVHTDVEVYFAHPYSPHERGSNENRNKVLRRFIPRGIAIESISDEDLTRINWMMNTMPLKCLNWKKPLEVFMENKYS